MCKGEACSVLSGCFLGGLVRGFLVLGSLFDGEGERERFMTTVNPHGVGPKKYVGQKPVYADTEEVSDSWAHDYSEQFTGRTLDYLIFEV